MSALRVIALQLLLAAGCFVGPAYAQSVPDSVCPSTAAGCTVEEAYEDCRVRIEAYVVASNRGPNAEPHCVSSTITSDTGTWQGKYKGTGCYTNPYCSYGLSYWGLPCPSGTSWDDLRKKCAAPGECLALNEGIANQGPVPRTWTSYCPKSGCQLVMDPGYITSTVNGQKIYRGELSYSGASCSPEGTPPPEEQLSGDDGPQCVDAGSGVSMCVKPNGSHCYTATATRSLCWRQGETGIKVDGSILQVRQAGTTPPAAPPTPPPPGESWAPPGPTTVVNTTGPTVNITTNVTNFGTTNGTNAGGDAPDQGEGTDANGVPNGQTGGTEGGTGSVTGGVNCDAPPAVNQGDPLLANIILQTWGTKCAIESANAVTSTGEIGDCKSEWTIEGPADDANVQKLKAARAAICGNDANGDGQPDWTEGDKPGDPGEGEEDPQAEPVSSLGVGTDLLDETGILGGSSQCPVLGVIDFGPLGQFDLMSVPFWCDLVQIMRGIVLLMAAFAAVKILMGV